MIRTKQYALYILGLFITALCTIIPVFERNYVEVKKKLLKQSLVRLSVLQFMKIILL